MFRSVGALLPILFSTSCLAASTFSPARPPAIPLAVKSPYVSCWQQAGKDVEPAGLGNAGPNGPGNGGYLAGQFPSFWSGQTLGWTGLIRVDGTTYTWMGNPNPLPPVVNQTSFEYTATRSIFVLVAGAVNLNVTFLSPVFPTDLKRQSLPFSYVDVRVSSSDGESHDVELYTDITSEWASGDRSAAVQWDYGVTAPAAAPAGTSATSRRSRIVRRQAVTPPGGIAYHKFFRQTQLVFSESAEQTDFGSWYWATSSAANLTHQSGQDVYLRGAFTRDARLSNGKDTRFRAVNDALPTFAFAVNLGSVGAEPVNTLFTLGLAQQQAVQFNDGNGTNTINSLWTSYFANELDALSFFHGDYPAAFNMTADMDGRISSDSNSAGGSDYPTLTTLATRQAFAGTQLANTPDTPYLFLKELSSNGNMQTADIIFPSHPIWLYANPQLLKLLLDPLFIYQESGKYPNQYAIHDLGARYPNATGHDDGKDEPQPLEECGNMIIMTLAYSQRAQDIDYLRQHYPILKKWVDFLVMDAIMPGNQISTDDFAGALANQTNLALKGIVGIGAMGVIANLTGNTEDATNYTNISRDYIARWQDLGIAHDANPPHATLAYGANETYSNLYNLYGDKELGLNLVPGSVYDMQSNFYPTVNRRYGVLLDTRNNFVKNDESLLTAATTSANTSSLFISDIARWINETPTNRALTDLYDADTGDYPTVNLTFTARPVVGGFFSLLALMPAAPGNTATS